MKKAVIKNNIVENIILADDNFTMPDYELVAIPDSVNPNIGSRYENGAFIAPVVTVAQARERRLEELKALRMEKINQGFRYTVSGTEYIFQVDAEAQRDMLAVQSQFILNVSNPHGGFWMSQGNVAVNMNDASVQAFFQAAFSYVNGVKARAWAHRTNLNNLNAKQDIEDYDITIGWPQ